MNMHRRMSSCFSRWKPCKRALSLWRINRINFKWFQKCSFKIVIRRMRNRLVVNTRRNKDLMDKRMRKKRSFLLLKTKKMLNTVRLILEPQFYQSTNWKWRINQLTIIHSSTNWMIHPLRIQPKTTRWNLTIFQSLTLIVLNPTWKLREILNLSRARHIRPHRNRWHHLMLEIFCKVWNWEKIKCFTQVSRIERTQMYNLL